MTELVGSFWRAAGYCVHPRVMLLSLLPLFITAAALLIGYWLFWDDAVAAVRSFLEGGSFIAGAIEWVEGLFDLSLRASLAAIVVVALAVPLVVVAAVLLVGMLMSPVIVNLVAARRFPLLERRHGASFAGSVLWSLGCAVAALGLLVLSIPLWFIPPLVLLVPPLIWGWLTYRVMTFDALADHASRDERQAIMREHRLPLLGIGVISGYLGAAPSLLWAFGVLAVALAPLLAIVSIWLYTLVFAFSAAWFAHYALSALQDLRSARNSPPTAPFTQPRIDGALPPPALPSNRVERL